MHSKRDKAWMTKVKLHLPKCCIKAAGVNGFVLQSMKVGRSLCWGVARLSSKLSLQSIFLLYQGKTTPTNTVQQRNPSLLLQTNKVTDKSVTTHLSSSHLISYHIISSHLQQQRHTPKRSQPQPTSPNPPLGLVAARHRRLLLLLPRHPGTTETLCQLPGSVVSEFTPGWMIKETKYVHMQHS